MSALDIVLAVALGLGGYLLGSIPFALVVGKWGFGVDVRDHGSGNVGTTNVFRVLGRKAGILRSDPLAGKDRKCFGINADGIFGRDSVNVMRLYMGK